ncbi:uncharacterized protein LOC115633475 [Scaptodrosophila lebanonensis]|uniref:Uncharacterized protein LOC115633475 n=1 Tax=Drosophila lebanonensis TaxID=7225 RepID=A0A6J2UHB3_DROLE|nr:uncharacterized protein LOC115633475 [Scaptodrosophila lebanonensis]
MTTFDWKTIDGASLNWNRSFSEPDLTSQQPHSNRFTIKHPHEYIAVDDLKYFRRRQPVHSNYHSNICLYNSDEPVLPFGSLKSEYTKHFRAFAPSLRPALLRRATSLRLEGLMQLLSEHQDKYHWYTPEDLQFSRTFPVRNPENFQLGADADGGGNGAMKNSSYLTYPMLNTKAKIMLPREMFAEDNAFTQRRGSGAVSKPASDQFKRNLAVQEQHKCHLQMRAQAVEQEPIPSEYKRQYVQFPIEKAHSIPQMSSIKIQGDFVAVPEYQDSFKMYANYSKSAPIKKHDNLRMSGAEVEAQPHEYSKDLPEYRDKFNDPPKHMAKEKPLKTDDHLHPRGEFSKDVPEYYESFRDPQVKEMPERGKCREPYLRLRGKIEFNPEYRNTYLDFPRSRPIVRKPASSFRLPTSGIPGAPANGTSSSLTDNQAQSCRGQQDSSYDHMELPSCTTATDMTATPEYRRANYNYQLRERTPTRKLQESDGGGNSKLVTSNLRKSSDSSLETRQAVTYKRRTSRPRQVKDQPNVPNFEEVGGNAAKKPARFGRRASVLQNAANCRENSSIIEGNPKYAVGSRRAKHKIENQQGSFVVLDEPCKPSNWMKKSWYDS